jgi:hypothetical protein
MKLTTEPICVYLFDEDVNCWRPVEAVHPTTERCGNQKLENLQAAASISRRGCASHRPNRISGGQVRAHRQGLSLAATARELRPA